MGGIWRLVAWCTLCELSDGTAKALLCIARRCSKTSNDKGCKPAANLGKFIRQSAPLLQTAAHERQQDLAWRHEVLPLLPDDLIELLAIIELLMQLLPLGIKPILSSTASSENLLDLDCSSFLHLSLMGVILLIGSLLFSASALFPNLLH
jgi:hypothetical protein